MMVVLALIASVVVAPSAWGDPPKEFKLTVEPPVVVDGVMAEFTVTVTNISSPVLGAVEISPPEGFVVNAVASAPSLATWSVDTASSPGKVRLTANTQTDRLAPGQSVSIGITATPPSADGEFDDADVIAVWSAEGRQANNFNSGGNDAFQMLNTPRDGDFVYRPGDGEPEPLALLTYETLVVSGDLVDCSQGPCTGTDSQDNVQVNINLVGCTVGDLVVDATDLFPDDDPIAIAGFYHYLVDTSTTATCVGSSNAVITFLYPKSLDVKAGQLGFKAFYGGKLAGYLDGTPLGSCSKNVTTNCVNYIKGGSFGVEAQITLPVLGTDPGGMAFR